ncbi:hypothetical protein QFC21_004738 [Naganishia friedmannii]|uniref:Uncharacterized protein n=1 Tax=Naganishia friedmannii TaxID=89922 RepID=A0ACC2VF63_9TREE|nr:hypothetical protein QFC21_004738 [Naganishia friedmannii]
MQEQHFANQGQGPCDFTFGRPAFDGAQVQAAIGNNGSPYRHSATHQHHPSVIDRRSSSPQITLPALTIQRPSHPTDLPPIREPGLTAEKRSISPSRQSPSFRRTSTGINLPLLPRTGSPSAALERGSFGVAFDTESGIAKTAHGAWPRINSPFLVPRPPSYHSTDSGNSDLSYASHLSTAMSTSKSPDRQASKMDPREAAAPTNSNGSRHPSPVSGNRPPFHDMYSVIPVNRSSPYRMGPPGEVSRTLAPLPLAGFERRGSASGPSMSNREHSMDKPEGVTRKDSESEEARDQVGDPADFDFSMRRHSIAVFQGGENAPPLRPLSSRLAAAPSPLGLGTGSHGHGQGAEAESEAARLAMNRKRKESHDRAAMGYFGDSYPGNDTSGIANRGPLPPTAPNHLFQAPAPPAFSNPFAVQGNPVPGNVPPEEFGPPTKRRGSTYDAKMKQLSLTGLQQHDQHAGSAGYAHNVPPQPWNQPFQQNDRRDSAVSSYSNRSLASSISGECAKIVLTDDMLKHVSSLSGSQHQPGNAMPSQYPPFGMDPTLQNPGSSYPPYALPPSSGNPGPPIYPQSANPMYQDSRASSSSAMSTSTVIPDYIREHQASKSESTESGSGSATGYGGNAILDSLPPDTRESIANGGSAPYSRSPELRVSHKLAERKRRKEMKDLFDELKDQLPADRGMKSSKWEILTRAVDYIATLKKQNGDMIRDLEALRSEVNTLRVGAAAAAAASGVTYGVPPPPHYPMSMGGGPGYNLPPVSGYPHNSSYQPLGGSSAPPSHGNSHPGTPVPR